MGILGLLIILVILIIIVFSVKVIKRNQNSNEIYEHIKPNITEKTIIQQVDNTVDNIKNILD